MIRYVMSKLLMALGMVLGATMLSFVLGALSPSDPAVVALTMDTSSAPTLSEIEAKRQELGLTNPLWMQYGQWLYHVVLGNWGYSYITGEEILPKLIGAAKVTILLTVLGTIHVLWNGIIWGTVLGYVKRSYVKAPLLAMAMLGGSVPTFWVAIILIYWLGESWHIVPTNGYDTIWHLVLPSFIISITGTSLLMRVQANAVQQVLRENYYLTALSKGLSKWYILYAHVLRNASLSSITVIGNYIIGMLGGAIIIEVIFSLPGLGSLMMEAIRGRDYPMIQGYVLIIGMMTAVINILMDLVYILLQPKLR